MNANKVLKITGALGLSVFLMLMLLAGIIPAKTTDVVTIAILFGLLALVSFGLCN